MLRSLSLWCSLALVLASTATAQNTPAPPARLTGTVVDAEDRSPIPGANVVAINLADTTALYGTASDGRGNFVVQVPRGAAYRLRVSFVGYRPFEQSLGTVRADQRLDTLALVNDVVFLKQVTVEGVQERVVVKGDTTEYNAAAFKVNQNATAEDLVSKMPGVTVQNGQVQAQGEAVRRVLVDGEEFFGDDATLALRNLPAEVIARVQVFDRASEQSQFTGFNDGNTEKTLNIVTRTGRNNGQFGKAYGGYGTDDRYQVGGNINIFDGSRRISILGLTNNINQQNFATEDLLGVMTAGRGGGGGFRGMGGGGGGFRGMGGGGFNPGDFLVGQQGGISRTNALGLNYSDRFGEKLRLSGSYFFNNAKNANEVQLDRDYFVSDATSQRYNEFSDAESDNFNHRLNLRLEYTVNEANSLIFSPRLSVQANGSESFLQGANALPTGALLNETLNRYTSDNTGFTSSSSLLWRHRFAKQGRTLSVDVRTGLNNRTGETNQVTTTRFYTPERPEAPVRLQTYDQITETAAPSRSVSTNVSYTEPLTSKSQLQLSYVPSWSTSSSDRDAFLLDAATGAYTLRDTALTSYFDQASLTQRGGLSYRLRSEKYNLSVGVDVQHEHLTGEQAAPTRYEVDRTFRSVLPSAMLRYSFSRTNSFMLFWRTSTNTPSASQLQNVVDNSNPLLLRSGNPDLKPSYNQFMVARYSTTNPQKGQTFMGFVRLSQGFNYIGNTSIIATADTLLPSGVLLPRGAQYAFPVNLDGYWDARSFFTLGRPVSFIKSNANLNAGLSYTRSPGLVNGARTLANVYDVSGGLTLGSNISEEVDFTLSYNANYNVARYESDPARDTDYVRHTAGGRLNWMPLKNLTLATDLNVLHYNGLDDDLYPSVVLWNAGVAYSFLRGGAGEVRLQVSDLLNQNDSVNRTVTELYTENSTSQVLGRYVMLNLTYRLKNFNLGGAPMGPPQGRREP